jgi:hypothetical protein
MRKTIPILLLSGCVLASTVLTQAQGPMAGAAGSPKGLPTSVMRKLFGENTAFNSRMEMKSVDKNGKETMSGSMTYTVLEGNTRIEMDMTAMKSADMQDNMSTMLKQWGMDKIVSISLPEKKSKIIIYPNLKGHVEMPLSLDEQISPADVKIEKTDLGKETLDGHPCAKSKVVVTDGTGRKFESVVWNATDLKNFPIQMQFVDKDGTSTMTYKDLNFERPSEKLFEAPAGSTRHESVQAMMGVVMQKMMKEQAGGLPAPQPKE